MKKIKKILAIALIALTMMAVAMPALAATGSLSADPGENAKGQARSIPSGRTITATAKLNTMTKNGTAYIDAYNPNKPVYKDGVIVSYGDWEVITSVQLGKGKTQSGTLTATFGSAYTQFRFRLFGWNDNGTTSVTCTFTW